MMANVELTGAARLHRAAFVLTAELENYLARRYERGAPEMPLEACNFLVVPFTKIL